MIGQHDAGAELTDGDFTLRGGFLTSPGNTPFPGCTQADQSPPFGTIDFNDVIVFLTNFSNGDPAADLSAPMGILSFNDVIAFLTIFSQGCP